MNKEAKMHCLGRIMTGLLGIVAFVLAAVIGQYSGWYKTPGWSWPIFGIGIVFMVIFVSIYAWIKGPKEKAT
jgi:MFS family permease